MTRDELLRTRITNPNTKRKVTVRYALTLPREHPAYRAAARVIQKTSKKRRSDTHTTSPRSTTPPTESLRSMNTDLVTPWIVRSSDLDDFSTTYMDGIHPKQIAAKYLKTLGATSKDDISRVIVAATHTRGYPEFTVSIALEDGTELVRNFRRRKNRNEWIVDHNYFALGSRSKGIGSGFAKHMLRDTLAIADELNIVAASFTASMASGGYVWARYGGIPDPQIRRKIMNRIQDQVVDIDTLNTRVAAAKRVADDRVRQADSAPDFRRKQLIQSAQLYSDTLDAIEKSPDTVSIIHDMITNELERDVDTSGRQIAPELLSYIANTPLGKYLLLGTEWYGYFNLRRGSLGRKMLDAALRD
jgi:hypothetical protein